MAKVRLGKTGFRFNGLHSLPRDGGYDKFLHGHDYDLTVLLEGECRAGDMLFDMRELKKIVETAVIAPLDHQNLDEILRDSCLETLVEWIWKAIRPRIPMTLRLGITLWETRTIFAEYWGE